MEQDEKPIYITNAKKRCMYCKGREVAKIIGNNVETNLISVKGGLFYCKDKKECEQNLIGENQEMRVSIDPLNNVTITAMKDGKPIMEVSKTENELF